MSQGEKQPGQARPGQEADGFQDFSKPLVGQPGDFNVTINGRPSPDPVGGEGVIAADHPRPGEEPLYHSRGADGRILIGGKDEVYNMTSAQKSDDNRPHWPITQRIPNDPNKAAAIAEARQAKEDKPTI